MNWFYSENGQQKGPISDMELTNLVRQGTLPASTLVWREGLPDWQPLTQARPDLTQVNPTRPVIGGVPVYDKGLLLQQMREGLVADAAGPGAVEFVGFWWRFLARFIDYILISAVNCLIAVPMTFVMAFFLNNPGGSDVGTVTALQVIVQLAMYAVQMAVMGGYYTWMTGKYGATLGKLALGFKVVTADGVKPTYLRSFGRWAADYLLSGTIFFIIFVIPVVVVAVLGVGGLRGLMESNRDAFAGGFVFAMIAAMFVGGIVGGFPWWMAAFDPEKRALHDRICATRVVRK